MTLIRDALCHLFLPSLWLVQLIQQILPWWWQTMVQPQLRCLLLASDWSLVRSHLALLALPFWFLSSIQTREVYDFVLAQFIDQVDGMILSWSFLRLVVCPDQVVWKVHRLPLFPTWRLRPVQPYLLSGKYLHRVATVRYQRRTKTNRLSPA